MSAPPTSLRDEVADAMRRAWIAKTDVPWPHEMFLLHPLADAVLAVLRERLEALAPHPTLGDSVSLDDVLALFEDAR